MRKTNYIKKFFTFVMAFVCLLSISLVVRAEPMTFTYNDNGYFLYVEKDFMREFIGNSWYNNNQFEVYYLWTDGSLQRVDILYYTNNTYQDGVLLNDLQFPLYMYFFDFVDVPNNQKNDPMYLMFNFNDYDYRVKLYYINGIVNLKNTLSIDKSLFPYWLLGESYIVTIPMTTKYDVYSDLVYYSTRYDYRSLYPNATKPNIDSVIIDFDLNDDTFALYTQLDNERAIPRYVSYAINKWENSKKNNYFIFNQNYLYEPFINAVVVPNYINEREESMTDIFTTIFDTIFEYIYNFLNFDVLGLNIFTALLGIVSILLLVKIIKMFL